MTTERSRHHIEQEARRTARDALRALGVDIRRLREDAGISQARLAAGAGLSQGHLSEIECAAAVPSLDALFNLGAAFGGRLALRMDPGTGTRLRDHLQARMIEELLRVLDPRWRRYLEVPVHRPVRGVIDMVLQEPLSGAVVAGECQSEIRRLEQQIRWNHEKCAALLPSGPLPTLPGDEPPRLSSLLILRSTPANREIARTFGETLRTAYPSSTREAVRALTDPATAWPGSSLIWASVEKGRVQILDGPARGVEVGR